MTSRSTSASLGEGFVPSLKTETSSLTSRQLPVVVGRESHTGHSDISSPCPKKFSLKWAVAVICQRGDPAPLRFHVCLMEAFSAPQQPLRRGGLLGSFLARARAWLQAPKTHPKSWLCAPKMPKAEIESVPLYTKLVFEAPRLNL